MRYSAHDDRVIRNDLKSKSSIFITLKSLLFFGYIGYSVFILVLTDILYAIYRVNKLLKNFVNIYTNYITFKQFCFTFIHSFFHFAGKGRLYQTYSVSSSEDGSPAHNTKSSVLYNQPYISAHHLALAYKPTPGLSDTPSSSDNASDATLTDTELALARDNTLLVNNGKFLILY